MLVLRDVWKVSSSKKPFAFVCFVCFFLFVFVTIDRGTNMDDNGKVGSNKGCLSQYKHHVGLCLAQEILLLLDPFVKVHLHLFAGPELSV